jgi:signal transduction histidine kinase
MSLREPFRFLPTRSLYLGVLLAVISTLSLSFLAFHLIADHVQRLEILPTFDKFDEMQLDNARNALQRRGRDGLKEYLASLDRLFGEPHYLLDGHGIDLVTGVNRAYMLPAPPADKARVRSHGHWMLAHRSPDGLFWFTVEGETGPPQIWTFLPYYFLVLGTTAVLVWLAFIGVVSPIKRIAATIGQFGQGDLTARIRTKRRDEIGQLATTFDQMADRLERLIVSERRLLGDISHELRSPLARLKFAVKLARTSQDNKAALDRIERDVDRITSLVADIVEITFIEGDPAVQDTGIVRIGEIVDEVVRDCALEAQFRDCTIHVGGTLSGQVIGNHELLRRAIENVLRNGIRYSPKNSEIQLSIAENEREAVVAVRDFGPGVPETAISRIFNPFFRVEDARDANSGGSGMGLSIAKRAVQLHHGTITAENAAPGLRVRITIPLAAETGGIPSEVGAGAHLTEDLRILKLR